MLCRSLDQSGSGGHAHELGLRFPLRPTGPGLPRSRSLDGLHADSPSARPPRGPRNSTRTGSLGRGSRSEGAARHYSGPPATRRIRALNAECLEFGERTFQKGVRAQWQHSVCCARPALSLPEIRGRQRRTGASGNGELQSEWARGPYRSSGRPSTNSL